MLNYPKWEVNFAEYTNILEMNTHPREEFRLTVDIVNSCTYACEWYVFSDLITFREARVTDNPSYFIGQNLEAEARDNKPICIVNSAPHTMYLYQRHFIDGTPAEYYIALLLFPHVRRPVNRNCFLSTAWKLSKHIVSVSV